MRNAFADHMINLGKNDRNIFLTGDLGFNALEGVRDSFGERFINVVCFRAKHDWRCSWPCKKRLMVFVQYCPIHVLDLSSKLGMISCLLICQFVLLEMEEVMLMVIWGQLIMPLRMLHL